MRLRALREARGLTQPALEELSGVSQPLISMLEIQELRNEPLNPRWDTVCRLSYVLGERPENIFGLTLRFAQGRPPDNITRRLNKRGGKPRPDRRKRR